MERQQIETTLITMGVPVRLTGFNYIVDAIILLDRPEWSNPKWTSLYQCIGNIYYTNGSSVEKSIRKALQVTRDTCADYDAIEKYIGFAHCCNSNSLIQLHHVLKAEDINSESNIENIIRTVFINMLKERVV